MVILRKFADKKAAHEMAHQFCEDWSLPAEAESELAGFIEETFAAADDCARAALTEAKESK